MDGAGGMDGPGWDGMDGRLRNSLNGRGGIGWKEWGGRDGMVLDGCI